MKIEFEKIRWKNLLSTGNVFTEVTLNESATTLIVGDNGAGKSTILDALCFGLFGRPFRKTNKANLVNSINRRNMVVEVEFTVGVRKYLILRGSAPALFEIYQDGNLINQEATIRDYQKYLEQNILKLNFRSFTQIVILGSSSFVPFMQLKSSQRREIIEDLLDIRIFSFMNMILKGRILETKEDFRDIEAQTKLVSEKISLQEGHIKALNDDHQERSERIEEQVETADNQISVLMRDNERLKNREDVLMARIVNEDAIAKRCADLMVIESQLTGKLRTETRHLQFFESEEVCPTCDQTLEDDYRQSNIDKYQKAIDKLVAAIGDISDNKIKKLVARMDQIQVVQEEITEIQSETAAINTEIQGLHHLIKTLGEGKNPGNIIDIKAEDKKLRKFVKEEDRINARKHDLLEIKSTLDVAAFLLKDTGIKTQIIQQYIPVINQLINKYLASLDFFVNFELDENFKESIKSRYRDDFTYASFSEGEKLRIDLSILFAWRSVAKLKNSVNTNILLLDEILDGSLDLEGSESFLKIIGSMYADANIFVISHKGDQLNDKFDQILRFSKTKNFSTMTEGVA